MKGIIIYTTEYGSTKQYAKWVAEKIKLPIYEFKKMPDLAKFDLIIIGAPIYAGKPIRTEFLNDLDKKMVLFSPCLNTKEVDFPAKFFPLPGRMNVKKLKFLHKMIVKMLIFFNKTVKDHDHVKKANLKDLITYLKLLLKYAVSDN